MSIDTVNAFEWVLMATFLVAALDNRTIGLCMLVNIAIGHFSYDWLLTIPNEAASIFINLVNVATIMLILWKGYGFQRILQPLILLGFIALEPLLYIESVYNNYEMILLVLYGAMFMTISGNAGHGIFNIFKFINVLNSNRLAFNRASVLRNHKNGRVG